MAVEGSIATMLRWTGLKNNRDFVEEGYFSLLILSCPVAVKLRLPLVAADDGRPIMGD